MAPIAGLGSPSKKAKFSDLNSSSSNKPSTHFVLKSDNTSTVTSSFTARPFATPRSFTKRGLSALTTKTPLTAPAGRSPTRKRNDKNNRRSAPFARFDPPVFGGGSMPFSIDAALSGSVSAPSSLAPASLRPYNDAAQSILSSSKQSWFFDIHEDTPDQELGNLMEFSTQTLDISDDEEKFARKQEQSERGKENIPPELGVVDMVSHSTSSLTRTRTLRMDDEPRTPLGELEAYQYYAEGCDEKTSFIVPGDEDDDSPVDCSDKTQFQCSLTADARAQRQSTDGQQLQHHGLADLPLNTSHTDVQRLLQNVVTVEASKIAQELGTLEAPCANPQLATTDASSTSQDLALAGASSKSHHHASMEASSITQDLAPAGASRKSQDLATVEASSITQHVATVQASSITQHVATTDASSASQDLSPVLDSAELYSVESTSREEAPLFEIWESESAKEEDEEVSAS